jgi:glycosyltransferase involved in cell wall biosynthesis
MKNELVSVIVPVYNVEKYLSRCIDSILSQTYKNLEIILVDDGSTDNSPMICDDYKNKDSRIRVVHKKNEGVSVARNTGLDLANGTYISFVDSDDWIEPNLYERVITCINEKKADIVKYHYVVEENGVSKNTGCNYNYTGFVDKKELISILLAAKIQGECWSYVFKKELLSKSLRFENNIIYGEDILFTVELFLIANSIYFVEDSFYHYFQSNDGSVTKNANKAIEIIKTICIVYEKQKMIYKKYDELNNIVDKCTATNLFIKVCYHINKIYKMNKQKEIESFLLDDEPFRKLTKNVDSKKIKMSYKVFRFLVVHRLRICLRAYGKMKCMMININK